MKRKLLFSALFDIGTQEKAFDCGIVTAFINLEKDTLEVMVRAGWIELPAHRIDVPIDKIKNLDTLQKLYSCCKFHLEETITTYSGEKKITDFHISSTFESLMMYKYGKTYVGKNEDEPKEY